MDYIGINFPIGNTIAIIVVGKEPENFCLYSHLALCVLKSVKIESWPSTKLLLLWKPC